WYGAGAAVRAGERWEFTVRLRRPHGSANPGGFDLEAWMLERGLRATGYVREGARDSAAAALRLDAMVWRPSYAVQRARDVLREKLQQRLRDERYAGVLVALVLGDQRAIGEQDWLLFNRTGIAHLVSISGLHITMIAALAALAALVAFAVNPLLYTGVGLLLWDARGCARDERMFFGVRATRPGRRALATVVLSLLAGVWLTGCLAVTGVVVVPWEVGAVSVLTLVLGLLRLRWFSPLLAIAILVAGSAAAHVGHPPQGPQVLLVVWNKLESFHAAAWLAVAAAVCLTEAILLTLQGWLRPRAVYVHSRRGRPLGALAMHLAVVAPVAVWVPGGWWPFGQGVSPLGWPWLGGGHGLSWA
ncbi:MAG: ComEC/Rec2 family competence protein, partial [Alicyclobacillus sp.]|nr:ComEC/Rec2 family competence protein [Alicyclobacillus sp.]